MTKDVCAEALKLDDFLKTGIPKQGNLDALKAKVLAAL